MTHLNGGGTERRTLVLQGVEVQLVFFKTYPCMPMSTLDLIDGNYQAGLQQVSSRLPQAADLLELFRKWS